MLILWIGALAVALASLGYWRMWSRRKDLFKGLAFTEILTSLLSHLPDEDSPAYPHVILGVMLLGGIASLATGIANAVITSNSHQMDISAAVTIGAATFAVLLSFISFWTLWQTRRIEQLQGSEIQGFDDLIIRITKDIRKISKEAKSLSSGARREHLRVLLITKNPYWGVLSYPDEDFTGQFRVAIELLAKQAKEHLVKFEVLCGRPETIRAFNAEILHQADDNPLVIERCNDTRKFIEDVSRLAEGEKIFHEAREIPKLQFAIVGNVVYEFILSAGVQQSEIHRARCIREKRTCERFVETFEILKNALPLQQSSALFMNVVEMNPGVQGTGVATAPAPSRTS